MSPQSRLWSTRSQQGIVLAETAQEGAKVTAMGTRAGIVTDRLARVALGETTAATKQSCGQCSLHCRVTDAEPDTGPRARLAGSGNWWCCSESCSRILSCVVEKREYDSLPFSTAGIARVPGEATLRGPITSRDRRLTPSEAQ